ncbi:uncharacterized protein LOC123446633 [Hordeum vulgare subsp. vulgare]|uniref:uncharacterized protein LOC123446633 n=1 Tax=Hordeum vulgare subsp. vulgare TaxID=112509 RepID=UPI001D1A3C46|nr:uncharacterized protein LOC123446633 [Hordeum vulgare subsp. vulgare]
MLSSVLFPFPRYRVRGYCGSASRRQSLQPLGMGPATGSGGVGSFPVAKWLHIARFFASPSSCASLLPACNAKLTSPCAGAEAVATGASLSAPAPGTGLPRLGPCPLELALSLLCFLSLWPPVAVSPICRYR